METRRIIKMKPDFPCRLREIRKAKKMTTVALARASGISQDKIIHIEIGKGEGKPSTHLKLAKALGVSLDEYFGFTTLEPTSTEPETILADSTVTVDQLAPLPGTEITIKRVILTKPREFNLTRYLNARKPVLFYLAQGEAKIWIHEKEHLLKSGENLSLSLPGKVRLQNLLSNQQLTLLLVQP